MCSLSLRLSPDARDTKEKLADQIDISGIPRMKHVSSDMGVRVGRSIHLRSHERPEGNQHGKVISDMPTNQTHVER